MPFIDGQYVDMNPEQLAEALHRGQKIAPHYYDYEDATTRDKRINQEWDTINEVLKMKHPETWRKYNDSTWSPDTPTPGLIPIGGMNMARSGNPGTLANNADSKNALLSAQFQVVPVQDYTRNALSTPTPSFDPNKWRG